MVNIKSTEEFAKEVLESETPAILDFWRTSCGQCKMMERLYEMLDNQYGDKIKFAKMNIDDGDCMSLAEKFNVNHLPTFIVFKDGNAVGRLVGANTKTKFEEILADIYTIS